MFAVPTLNPCFCGFAVTMAVEHTKKLVSDGTKLHFPYTEKVFVGLESDFQTVDVVRIVTALMGESNLAYIANETGALVTLRGRGTNFLECDGQVSSEPLHIKIEHNRIQGLTEAFELAKSLVQTVLEEYLQNRSTAPMSVVPGVARAPPQMVPPPVMVPPPQVVPPPQMVPPPLPALPTALPPQFYGPQLPPQFYGPQLPSPPVQSASAIRSSLPIFYPQRSTKEEVAPTQEVAAVSNAAENQQSHRLSFAACTRFNKLVAEGVPFAQAKQQVQQLNVSTIQSKRQHSEETVPTDTAKRAKTDTPSKSAGAEMSHRKAGPDVRANLFVKAVQNLKKTTQKPQKIQFKIMTGSKVSQEKQNMARGSQHGFNKEEDSDESATQEIPDVSTAKGNRSISQLEVVLELLRKAIQIQCETVTDDQLKSQLQQVSRLIEHVFTDPSESKCKERNSRTITSEMQKRVILLVQILEKLFVSQPSYQVAKFLPIMKLLRESVVDEEPSQASARTEEKKRSSGQEQSSQSKAENKSNLKLSSRKAKSSKFANVENKSNLKPSSRQEKSSQSANVENKSSLKLSDVMQRLTRQFTNYINKQSKALHRSQLDNVLQKLKSAVPSNAKSISHEQSTNIFTIVNLLQYKLKDTTYTNPPYALFHSIKDLKTVLNSLSGPKSTHTSREIPAEKSETVSRPAAVTSSSTNQWREKSETVPQPAAVTSSLTNQWREKSKTVPQPAAVTSSSTNQWREKSETVPQPAAVTSAMSNQWQGYKHVYELDGKLKQPLQTSGGDTAQQVVSTGTSGAVVCKHTQVLQTIELLETNLESHANAMSLGQPKIQLLQITQNLQQVLQTHKGNMVSVQDQKQLMLIMQLLETLFQSQDLKTSSGQSPTNLIQIVQQVQQLLRNLAQPEPVQVLLPEVRQAVVPTQPAQRQLGMQPPFGSAAVTQRSLTPIEAVPTTQREEPSNPQAVELSQIAQMLQKGLQSLSTLSAPVVQNNVEPDNPQQIQLNQLLQQMQQVTQLLSSKQLTVPEKNIETVTTALIERSQEIDDDFGKEDGHTKLKQLSVSIGGEEKNIISVKPDQKSLYASLAYLLQGPFETQEELSPMACKFQKETVNFIRSNKDLFFTFVNRVYREVFPNDTLDQEMVFEKYCLFLAQSENLIVQVPLRAIATVFKTPIAVLSENGQRIIEPFFPTKRSPVEIVNTKLLNFCPVTEPELTIATWHVISDRIWGAPGNKCNEIDLCLKRHDVDIACLQGSESPGGKMFTKYYTWWGSESSGSKEVAFLVRKNSGVTLKNFTSSDGFISAEIQWKKHHYWMFGCNFLGSQNNNLFTKCLSEILSHNRSSVQIIVLGDFNALIGSSSVVEHGEKELIGTNLYHRASNEFGIILRDLAVRYNFRVVTSFPNENGLPPVTLKEENGVFQVSHILMENQPNQSIKNYLHWEDGFNHAVVASKISYPKPPPVDVFETKNDLQNVTFSTWNAGDCSTTENQELIDNVLFNKVVDLACIQGTNLLQGTLHTTHYDWWCCGSSRSANNIALLLRRNSGAALSNIETRSDSVASAMLTVGECSYAVVGCYLPHQFSPSYKDVACDIMLSLNTAPSSARPLLLGDFSALLGLEDLTLSEESHLAKKGLVEATSNANGIFLKRLALLHDLFICSTNKKVEKSVRNLHTSHILLRKGNSFHVEGSLKTYTIHPQKPYMTSYSIPRDAYYLE